MYLCQRLGQTPSKSRYVVFNNFGFCSFVFFLRESILVNPPVLPIYTLRALGSSDGDGENEAEEEGGPAQPGMYYRKIATFAALLHVPQLTPPLPLLSEETDSATYYPTFLPSSSSSSPLLLIFLRRRLSEEGEKTRLTPPPSSPPPTARRSWREEAGRGREAPVRGGGRQVDTLGRLEKGVGPPPLELSVRPSVPVRRWLSPYCRPACSACPLGAWPNGLRHRRQGGPNPTGCRSPSPASFPPSFQLRPIIILRWFGVRQP